MNRTIGHSAPRVDAIAKVTGEALFPGDLEMDGMLHMKILFSGRVHARILSLDTRAAESYPGVAAVLTAKDVPVNEYGLIVPDQPVLCGPGSAKAGADVVRTVLDQVALVIADSEENAAAARDLIEVPTWRWPTARPSFTRTDRGTCSAITACAKATWTTAGGRRR
jgi:CO/xanthine dehydrogenase Mo-binding subunit